MWQMATSFFASFLANVNILLDIPDLQQFCRTVKSLYDEQNDHIFCVYKLLFLYNRQSSIMYEMKINFSFYEVVPCIASDVKELKVFQRTPNWVPLREDYNFPTWLKVCFITLQ